jgi:hypothetical protein
MLVKINLIHKGINMNINNYEQHVAISKQLKMGDSFYEVREPHKEGFEKIYNQVQEEGINISNAKDFLNSLSKEEMSTLQQYTGLVDEINVGTISDEGAYNLLLHHYEKYDFDQDGLVSNGISKGQSLLPVNMPNDQKEILVQTLNEMSGEDRFKALLMINPPRFEGLPDGTLGVKQDDNFMDYEAIKERVDRILNPLPGEYASPEFQKLMSTFFELFDKNIQKNREQNEYINQQYNNEVQLTKAKFSNQEV